MSTSVSRGLMSWGMRAAAALLVASIAVAASPELAMSGGATKVVHVTTVGNATGSGQNLVLTGGIGDAGTLAINGATDTITLSHGTLTIDLSKANLGGRDITISAWAIVRDVEVIVSRDTHIELSGSVVWGDLTSTVPPASSTHDSSVVRIEGHALFGDVEVRLPDEHS